MISWPWFQMSTEPIPGCLIWWLSGHGSRCRRNRSQDARFDDFLAMVPDVDETDPRMVDLMTFWPWVQMSTEAIPSQPSQPSLPRQPTQPPVLDPILDSILNPMWNPVLDPVVNPILNPSNIESNDESNIQSSIGKRSLKAYVQDFTSRKIMTGDLYHLNSLLFN